MRNLEDRVKPSWALSPWQNAQVGVIEHKLFVLSCRLKAIVELHEEGEIDRAILSINALLDDTLGLMVRVSDFASTIHATAILTAARPPQGQGGSS